MRGKLSAIYYYLKKPRKVTEKKMRRLIKKLEPPVMKAEIPKKEKAELETIEQKLDEILK